MSKKKQSRYGKKKTARNILIGVIAAIVIAVAIFLVVALQKDGAGMNCFQRNAAAVTGDGVQASVAEYRIMFDMRTQNYQSMKLSDAQIRTQQELAAREALMQKIYVKEAKALGLKLTEEQIAACKKSADDQIASIEQYYATSMVSGGTYSKAALDKQISSYFQHLGMSKDAYRNYLKASAEAEYYRQALEAYYQENGSGFTEDELVAYYRKTAEGMMTTVGEDGTEQPAYSEGQFWYKIMLYQIGYDFPMLYVPEGFIYIDYIRIEAATTEEAEQIIAEVVSGERSFDELKDSDANKDTFKTIMKAPYPIAEKDHSMLFTADDAYAAAAALEIGQIGSYIEEQITKDDGTTSVTAYLFRRAEGNICYEGDHGVIDLDYYTGIRTALESDYRMDQWFSDLKYEDVIYTYKGVLE